MAKTLCASNVFPVRHQATKNKSRQTHNSFVYNLKGLRAVPYLLFYYKYDILKKKLNGESYEHTDIWKIGSDFDTKKAREIFKERKIKYQLINMTEKRYEQG